MIVSHRFSSMYNEGIVIWRQDPIRRMITIKTLAENHAGVANHWEFNNYFLSFPYVFFRISYKFNKKSFLDYFLLNRRKLQFISLEIDFSITPKMGKFFKAPLYNIYRNNLCCLGFPIVKSKNVEILSKEIINHFWSSQFNQEMRQMHDEYLNEKMWISNYNSWQFKTKKDPSWIPNEKNLLVNKTNLVNYLGKNYKEMKV